MKKSSEEKSTPIGDLETALIARAKALADEHMAHARRSRDQIITDANERQRLREEREILAAKAVAERAFRQRQQAAEIKQQEEVDRLRWNLVLAVMAHLPTEIEKLITDEKIYLPLMRKLLTQAANAVAAQELVAEVNARDHARLSKTWEVFCREAGVKNHIVLTPESISCSGGVRLRNVADTIRVDNSFEGRLERLQDGLYQIIMERLFASTASIGAMIDG